MNIQYKNLQIKRGNTTIINDFSLTIDNANLCVIVGPSGSGKSTILEATAGLIPVETGQILFNQNDITNFKPNERQIGYVFQDFALYPNMTVFQNIEFGLKVQKVGKQKRTETINQILKMIELEAYANHLPSNLSGGQKQRVAIARALVLEPEVLLMDEPLSSLDASLRQQMRNQIIDIQKRFNKTIIFVTHDQSEALALADHIVVLKDGEIIAQGAPFELYNNPPSEFILRFFNSEHLNVVEDSLFINNLTGENHHQVFIRPADIKLTTGSLFTVTQTTLHGESQIVTLTGPTKLFVSIPSKTIIHDGQQFNIEVERWFKF